MGFSPTIPTPEQMQYLMGIHPSQVAVSNALAQSAQGPANGETAESGGGAEGNSTESEGNSGKPENSGNSETSPSPSVARPDSSVRGIGGSIASPKTAPEEKAPTPNLATVPSPTPDLSGLTTTSTSPVRSSAQARQEQDQERTARDQEKLDAMRAAPAGVVNFQHRHHILGPLVRGLEIAGSVVAPGVMTQVPGTTLNRNLNIARQSGVVKEDLGAEKESADIENKQEVDAIRQQAEADRRQAENDKVAYQQQIAKLRKDAEERQEAMRDITYDAKTGKFMRGGRTYEPKDFQEGAQLEIQNGITTFDAKGNIVHAGPNTIMWDREKRNQAPVTHIHNPSAESEHYNDVKEAFKSQFGHYPQSPDDFVTFNGMLKGERGERPVHAKDRQAFEEHWGKRFSTESDKVFDKERAAIVKRNGVADITKDKEAWKSLKSDDQADITQSLQDLEQRRTRKNAELQAEKDTEAERYGIYTQPPATASVTRPGNAGGTAGTSASGNPLTHEEARDYLRKAGGDKNKARQMARKDGRAF